MPLRSEVFVAPAAILQTSAKTVFHPMLEPTKPPKAQAQEDKRRKVCAVFFLIVIETVSMLSLAHKCAIQDQLSQNYNP